MGIIFLFPVVIWQHYTLSLRTISNNSPDYVREFPDSFYEEKP